MNFSKVSLPLIPLFFLITLNVCSSDHTYTAHYTGDVSINCGSTGTSSAQSGRQWLGDVQQKSSPLLQLKGMSTTSTAIRYKSTPADPVPYMTARISRSQFSYAFQLNPGQKTIRFHFNPSAYRGFKGLKDLFSVEAGSFTLLSNFSASVTADVLRVNSLTKEFCLNIQDSQLLHITFSAETSQSKDAYAFINGIEIVSVPAGVSYFQGGDNGIQVVGENTLVSIDNSIALEIICRLNIKQDEIVSSGDGSDGISWKVSVDVGFRYLVRLHFSKLGLKMAQTGALKFNVFINEMIANTKDEMVVKERESGGMIPWYGDYVVMMSGQKLEGKRDLLIRLQSNEEIMDGAVKGFDILKLSNPDNSLASPVAMPPSQDSTSPTFQILLKVLGHRNAIVTVGIAILSLIGIIAFMLREIWEARRNGEGNKPSARAERFCRQFSLSEMRLATRNFSEEFLIGKGGFGKVYKGLVDKGRKTVAIKRLKPNSKQGEREFLMEIETLSGHRHINFVSLIGYCREGTEMILVYEYMARGTLADNLYNFARRGIDASSLTWKQRLNICIGAARGIDYLHTGYRVIHRDVNSSNILLDDNFVAKLSDFGLAKPESRSKSHVSTKVKGTVGYLDPHYYTTRKLTRKCDTYALGVVLLEVLCGRPAEDSGVSNDKRTLTMWAQDKISRGEVDQIVASSLRDEILPNSLKTFVEITERCLLDEPNNRPKMSEIVLQLELALEHQDNSQKFGLNEIASSPNRTRLSITLQPTVDSNNMQNLTSSPNQQTNKKVGNSDLISGRSHKGKSPRNKPSRLWPWDAFWNRVKPSKKHYKLLLSDVNLPKFDWDEIAAATNNLSTSNIVAFRGFGRVVYKAVLPSGKVVAVKRRASSSAAEGQKEFKNEIYMLPNLLHRNIIKLLGYCIDGEELYLVHEFMENTLLDYFTGQEQHLEWGVRFQIIMGIARGLVYLHHDSGLRITHRDLTIKCILLDSKMNPKICDFELARSMAGSQSEQDIDSPEEDNCMHRNISVKTDVHDFGIILLEIVSGRRAFDNLENHTLVEHAWKLWNERRTIELVDESVQESAFGEDEAVRCIQVALLCIQDHPDQRPWMSSVIKMLEGNEQIRQPQLAIEVPAVVSENTNVDVLQISV
ncbi:hypothetical protein ACS0TY_029129 [Phlomoides rotata]